MTGRSAEDLRLPDYLILGAMKAGTTLLARSIGDHPQGFMARQKEIHFFDWQFDQGLEWYAEFFAGVPDDVMAGEASPAYLRRPEALERIASTLPGARLIVSLRNPVDRAYSHYWHQRTRGRETRPFRDAIAEERPSRPDGSFDYVSGSRYIDQLLLVDKLFDRSQLHVLVFEELCARPEETFAEVCSFLGLDPSISPSVLGRSVNAYVEFRSLRAQRVIKALPVGKKWRTALAGLNRRNVQYPALDEATRAELEAEFQEPNAQLAEFLGRELPW